MKNIQFSPEGKLTFYFSFILGTLLLVVFLLTKSDWVFVTGFYYVLIAVVINVIIFFHELIFFLSNISDHKAHGNSALLILLNIPISIIYFRVVFNYFNL